MSGDDQIYDRAREFIDDILRINAEHGMSSVEDEGAYEAAVASAAKWALRLRAAVSVADGR